MVHEQRFIRTDKRYADGISRPTLGNAGDAYDDSTIQRIARRVSGCRAESRGYGSASGRTAISRQSDSRVGRLDSRRRIVNYIIFIKRKGDDIYAFRQIVYHERDSAALGGAFYCAH